MKIFSKIKINKKEAKNRIMMPPLVIFGVDTQNGEIGEFRQNHYEMRAKDGIGTIVVEAAGVSKEYAITPCQIGIWDDCLIGGLTELAERIKKYGSLAIIQIQHAGGKPHKEINSNPFGPSDMEYAGHNVREATVDELRNVCDEFVAAAARAKKAGFDGVEIHNAHGYLLTQMVSPILNKRTDEYGGTPEKRMKLSIDILKGIRAECGDDFIIGVRFGANEPSYKDGVFIAKMYEQNGIDYLSASTGHSLPDEKFDVPDDFPNNAIVYGGKIIHDNVKSVPVVLVNQIKSLEQGEWLLEQGYGDMIAFGRPLLVSGEMITRFNRGLPENLCFYCKSWCVWARNPKECPGLKNMAK